MKEVSKHSQLLTPFIVQALLFCLVSAIFTALVAVAYGVLTTLWHQPALRLASFLPSDNALEAAVLGGVTLALFNATGDSVEIDCDQGRKSHSTVTYGLALTSTFIFALVLERVSNGTWLQPHIRTWPGAAVVGAYLFANLLAIRWHRKCLLSPSQQD